MTAYYRIYYDRNSGESICTTWARGDVRIPEQDEDFAWLPALSGRTKADTGIWERMAHDAELEWRMQTKLPRFELSGGTAALTWTDFPPVETGEVSGEELLSMVEEVL